MESLKNESSAILSLSIYANFVWILSVPIGSLFQKKPRNDCFYFCFPRDLFLFLGLLENERCVKTSLWHVNKSATGAVKPISGLGTIE